MVMGFSCGMIILLNILLNLLGALGIIPQHPPFLPFYPLAEVYFIVLCIGRNYYEYSEVIRTCILKKSRASGFRFQKTIYNVKMD